MRSAVLALALFVGAVESAAQTEALSSVKDQIALSRASGTSSLDWSDFDTILAETVHDGRVDYPALAARRGEFDRVLTRIAEADLSSLAKQELKALFINAYNAYTIVSILDRPGIKSIREIPGVWTERRHLIGGHLLTLDELEHDILRPVYDDQRIHFAVNCASKSCAPLASFAFRGNALDTQLEERTRHALTRADFLRIREDVVPEKSRIEISAYFDWFQKDFGNVKMFLSRYGPMTISSWIRKNPKAEIVYQNYDWALNGPPVPEPTGDPR